MEMDLTSRIGPTPAFDTKVISTNETHVGNIIDSKGFESLDFSILSGTITDGTFTALIEDGDESNLSDAATVASTDLIGTLPVFDFDDSESNLIKHVGYRGKKRYVRLSIVSADTAGGTISAVAILGNSKSSPTQ
jgi:hypothetical protein